MRFDYKTICYSGLLKELSDRQREVIVRRFGLAGPRETLESVGQKMGITRERVRQIEKDSLTKLKNKIEDPSFKEIFQYFTDHLKKSGGLKREDLLLEELGGSDSKNYVLLLLTLGPFVRVAESEDFYSFWTTEKIYLDKAKKAVNVFISELKKKKTPLPPFSIVPVSYLQVSKKVLMGQEGLYGLPDWPEIKPRGVKDKAYLVLKKERRPLHFTEVASLVHHAVPQTVHNELIKDSRFVLVGRGLYALQEWGYMPGAVKEVIARTIQESGHPLDKNEVLKKVLEQRQVHPNTILLNLQNKKFFIKNSDGKYTIRKV